MTVSKTTMKKKVHRAFLRNIMGQTYLIYACTGTNHTRNCIGSRWLEARVFKKNLILNDIDIKRSSSRCFQGYNLYTKIT